MLKKIIVVIFRHGNLFCIILFYYIKFLIFSQYAKEFLEISELIDIERKIEMYKAMFYCNDRGDRDINYIKAEDLKIELMAGGLNWEQQQFIMDRVQPNEWREVLVYHYAHYRKHVHTKGLSHNVCLSGIIRSFCLG